MRVAILAAFIVLNACASSGLRPAPPAGVDLSGHWKLNAAESDDPLHLLQAANNQAIANAGNAGNSGGGGRAGGRGGQQAAGYPRLQQPATPTIGALGEALHFPGKSVEIKQVGGVVAFTSEGKNRVCQPSNANRHSRQGGGADRDVPMAAREVAPPTCGWSDKTLIVRSREPDEDRPPFEEHYSLSEDGQRLVEEISFSGGRSNGFTVSRVWDRQAQ